MACCSRFAYKRVTKGLFSDGIAVRPTAATARYWGCVAMRCRLAGTLTTSWRVCPPSGSSWRRRAGTFCSPQVRRRGLQSTRRTTTTMPAPAAGARSTPILVTLRGRRCVREVCRLPTTLNVVGAGTFSRRCVSQAPNAKIFLTVGVICLLQSPVGTCRAYRFDPPRARRRSCSGGSARLGRDPRLSSHTARTSQLTLSLTDIKRFRYTFFT